MTSRDSGVKLTPLFALSHFVTNLRTPFQNDVACVRTPPRQSDDYYCQSQWQSVSLHDRSTVCRSNASVPQPALQSSCSRLQSSHPNNDHHRQHTPATGQRTTVCESQRVLHDVTTLNPPPPPFVTFRHTSMNPFLHFECDVIYGRPHKEDFSLISFAS